MFYRYQRADFRCFEESWSWYQVFLISHSCYQVFLRHQITSRRCFGKAIEIVLSVFCGFRERVPGVCFMS